MDSNILHVSLCGELTPVRANTSEQILIHGSGPITFLIPPPHTHTGAEIYRRWLCVAVHTWFTVLVPVPLHLRHLM